MTSDQANQLLEEAIRNGLQKLLANSGEEMMTVAETCRFFGGDRPLNPATLYRGVKAGRFPPPVRIGGGSRWRRSECTKFRDGAPATLAPASSGESA